MAFQSISKILCIIILIMAVEATSTSSCDSKDGYSCYGSTCCRGKTWICANMTTKDLTEFFNKQKNSGCYYDCQLLYVHDSKIFSIENEIIENIKCLNKVLLMNNHIQHIAEDAFIDYPRMQELQFDFNEITKINFVDDLHNLRILKLSHNNLSIIQGNNVKQLRQLTTFDVSYNQLYSIGNTSYNLQALTNFYINNNNISNIEPNIFRKLDNLQILNISYNKLASIDNKVFNKLQNLQILSLSHNMLIRIEENAFNTMTNLKSLYLNNNFLEILQEDMFHGLSNLEYLYLQENPIRSIVPKAFISLEHLLSIDVSGIKINTLPNYTFIGLGSLQFLNLSNWSIESIKPGAFNGMSQLNRLDLTNNNIKILQSEAFNGLYNLYKIYLLRNKIQFIEPYAFSGLSTLPMFCIYGSYISIHHDKCNDYNTIIISEGVKLELNDNIFQGLRGLYTLNFVNVYIDKIKTGAFNGLVNLRNVDFHNTTVEVIESKVFAERPGLNIRSFQDYSRAWYNLSSLSIQYIAPNVFDNSFTDYNRDGRRSNYIYLNNNNLTTLNNNTFQKIIDLSVLTLDDSNIQEIQSNAFNGISFRNELSYNNSLYINNNKLKVVHANTFSKIKNVVELRLDKNVIVTIDPGSFNGLHFHFIIADSTRHNLERYNTLYLNDNQLVDLSNGTFTNIMHLVVLKLENNNIRKIEPGAFNGLVMHSKSLNNQINLENNQVAELLENTFRGTQNLIYLRIDHNKINKIEAEAFSSLTTLKVLNIGYNNLENIVANAFIGMQNLEKLDLTHNKITSLNPESFAGLVTLQDLILTQNMIKDIPLGTFKNFPNLKNLQLGNNLLSQFVIGTFSNLGALRFLNFSENNFSDLNPHLLYPLRNLNLLDLDDNTFSYINYTSLLSHLPNLNYISVNNNKWECTFLTHMLKAFRFENVDYLFNVTSRYTEKNVDGVFCTEDRDTKLLKPEWKINSLFNVQMPISIKENFTKNVSDTLSSIVTLKKEEERKILFKLNLIGNNTESINLVSHNLEALNNNSKGNTLMLTNAIKNSTLMSKSIEQRINILSNITDRQASNILDILKQLYQLNINETFKISKAEPKSININLNLTFYVIVILILITCTTTTILFAYTVYKKYFNGVKRDIKRNTTPSEMELFNASS